MKTHATRNTQHATHPTSRAFTLIELLVVIGLIALLAAMSIPVMAAVKRAQAIARAQAELKQVETAIEFYQHKLGYYPPDNPPPSFPWTTNNLLPNQLYYELLGTTNVGTAAAPVYMTLDGSARIKASDLATFFGPNVTGFMNCAQAGRATDEAPNAVAFLQKGLKASQFMSITNGSSTAAMSVLGTGVVGPLVYQNTLGVKLNPWRYNSSGPQHNPKSFDLWVDITVGNYTYRISNWSDRPIIVTAPFAYP